MMHDYILKNHFKGWKETKKKKKTTHILSTEKGAGRKSTTLLSSAQCWSPWSCSIPHSWSHSVLRLLYVLFSGGSKGHKSQPIVMSISTQPQGTAVDIYEGTCLKVQEEPEFSSQGERGGCELFIYRKGTVCSLFHEQGSYRWPNRKVKTKTAEKQPVKHQQLGSMAKQTKPIWRSMHISLFSQISGSSGRGNPCYIGSQ